MGDGDGVGDWDRDGVGDGDGGRVLLPPAELGRADAVDRGVVGAEAGGCGAVEGAEWCTGGTAVAVGAGRRYT